MSKLTRIWVRSPIIDEWRELTGYEAIDWKVKPNTYYIGVHDGLLHVYDKDGARLTFSMFYIEERTP